MHWSSSDWDPYPMSRTFCTNCAEAGRHDHLPSFLYLQYSFMYTAKGCSLIVVCIHYWRVFRVSTTSEIFFGCAELKQIARFARRLVLFSIRIERRLSPYREAIVFFCSILPWRPLTRYRLSLVISYPRGWRSFGEGVGGSAPTFSDYGPAGKQWPIAPSYFFFLDQSH